MQIEKIVAGLPYEHDPSPTLYAPDGIAELETMVGRLFPDELRWYLANIGWRRIESGQRTVLVRRGDNLLALEFEAAEHEVFATKRYDEFVHGREGELLPHDRRFYVPLGKLAGFGDPPVALHLLVNLNDEDQGSLWAVRTIGFLDSGVPSLPIRIADDLASFLLMIGPASDLDPQAEEHEEKLFERLLKEHLVSAAPPTTAKDPQALVALALEQPSDVVLDGTRNVEYAHYSNGLRVETAAEFAEAAVRWAAAFPAASPSLPARRDVTIGQPQPFNCLYALNRRTHGYALVTVDSLVGGDGRLHEEYLLHKGEAGWTMVRRYAAAMADRRIKGLGTFAYDKTQGWTLKKKVKPLWSNLSLEVRIEGDEGALTTPCIAFVRQVIDYAEFRPLFESHVFRLYTETMRPEFEAMPEAEKAEWADCYPAVSEPGGVWTLLKRGTLWISGDDTFHLQSDALWDPEHGLTVRVRGWHIMP